MRNLYLDVNYLTGEIPPELGNVTNLNKLFLNGNDLVGTMPPEICHLRDVDLNELVSDCSGPDPDLVCSMPDCCTECDVD